jgi:hypothetical protein
MGLALKTHMFPLAANSPHPERNARHPWRAARRRHRTGLDRLSARSQGEGTVAVPTAGQPAGALA